MTFVPVLPSYADGRRRPKGGWNLVSDGLANGDAPVSTWPIAAKGPRSERPAEILVSSFADIVRLIDGRHRRRHILELARGDGDEPSARLILDDLDHLGLLKRQGGRLDWTGPESPELLHSLVSLRDGPARSLIEIPSDEACPVFVYAVPDSEDGLTPHLVRWGGAAGTGMDRRAAVVSCLFETAERCSQIHQGDEPARIAAFDEIADKAIHPDAILMPGDPAHDSAEAPSASTPIVPLPLDLPISWSEARDLGSGTTRWLPTDICYRSAGRAGRSWTCPADSSGCSTGRSQEDIAVRGFLELVERDAVSIWWYNRILRPRVPFAIADHPSIRSIVGWQRRRGRRFHLLDLTSDLEIPVVAAVSCAEDGRGIAVGFGVGFEQGAAAMRASLEMMQFQVMIEFSLGYRDDGHAADASPATEKARSWFETVSIATESHLLPSDSGVMDGPAPALASSSAPEVQLNHCLAIAARHGLDLLFIDMTRPWIGVPAGRVLVPGLRSLRPRFGAGRLFDVPVKLGWLTGPRRIDELNDKAMVF